MNGKMMSSKSKGNTEDEAITPQQVSSLVSMPVLLSHLGFQVNERVRRSKCILCAGHNPTTFSWREDGRWHCFRCNSGGDKITLIRCVLQCGFRDAMQVLSRLAGLPDPKAVAWRGPTRQEMIRQDRLKEAAEKYLTLENMERLSLADDLRRIEVLYDLATSRLVRLRQGAQERFPGEEELVWDALAFTYRNRVPLLAAYLVVSFSTEEEKQTFVLYPSRRLRLIDDCICRGGVLTDTGAFVEIAL
jgi:hypothetical protein